MISIATIVTTAPRPRPTLRESLVSYRHAGFIENVVVLSDGNPQEPTEDLNVSLILNEPALGCLKNWHRALSILVECAANKFDYMMVVQDDVLWALNSQQILNAYPPPGVTSLYCPRRVASHLLEKYGDPLPAGYFASSLGWETWGAQAIMFSPDHAHLLLNDEQFNGYVENYTKNKNVDRIVAKCLLDANVPMYYRIPCLVNHDLGVHNSSLGDKPMHLHLLTDYFADANPPSMAIH